VPEQAVEEGERKVYTVSAFNQGVASWISRLPTLWVEGEITELRRQDAWQSVFFTLKDVEDGSSVAVTMQRTGFDALRLGLEDGARVQVFGRPELWAARGSFQLRALTIEPVGLGAMLVRLERLRRSLAAEGLFAPERKRPLPLVPQLIGLVTGADAAAKRDVLAAIHQRFPPARILVANALVQGPRAPASIAQALADVCRAGADVIILTRGGGSFDDLLPFSDERLVRAVAGCPVPIVSAVGHEQDTPLCDLAADVRAATPTAAARLVVPDLPELISGLEAQRARTSRAVLRELARGRDRMEADRLRLARAPALLLERQRARLQDSRRRVAAAAGRAREARTLATEALGKRLAALAPAATLERGYAIVRREGSIVRAARDVSVSDRLEIQLATGQIRATVDDVRG
jgi:exodeoxyribonuclease VII large subunit